MNVNINNPSQFVDIIPSNENRDVVFTVSLDENVYDGESLDLVLIVSNGDDSWNLPVPANVYGPKLEFSGYEVVGNSILEPGVESTLDLLFHNSGTTDIDGLIVELDDSNDFIQIVENNISSISISAGEQVILNSFQIMPASQHKIHLSSL